MRYLLKTILIFSALAYPLHVLGQGLPVFEDQSHKTFLDRSPLAMARSSGMAGAASGVATGVDAIYHNPAGIGGLDPQASSGPWVKQLHFPYFAASANAHSVSIQQQFNENGAATDGTIKDAIVQANAGNRVYARFSMFPNILVGRVIAGIIIDRQLASVPVGNENLVETRYHETQGPALGFSIVNSKKTLYFGASTAILTRSETVGQFRFSAIDNPLSREEIFSDARTEYNGTMHTVGFLWRIAPKLMPTLSLVARNVGNTTFVSSNPEREDIHEKQDLVMGFSITPIEKKGWQLVTTLQFDDLENGQKNLPKKFRAGAELLIGQGTSERAPLALRAGYNAGGMAMGLQLNLGLFGLQASSYAEDVGVNNRRVIDRRQELVLKIDVAEY